MAMQVLEAADEESAEYLSNFSLDLDTEGLDADVQEPCQNKQVCIMKCGLVHPGCRRNTFAEVQGTSDGNVPAHYYQHSCMYRWGMNPQSSWIFNLVYGEYQRLVSSQGYPAVALSTIMQFEKDMYGVCATHKKCAGFGLSALGSAYFNFDMECQKNPSNTSPQGLQSQLNARRGSGYGGADSQIQYHDVNKQHTYNLLAQAKARMDSTYINKMYNKQYDYCPCESFNQFHHFIKHTAYPQMQANPSGQWFGGPEYVYAATSAYLPQWPAFGQGMDQKIAGLKTWCRQRC
jgi:hypothetical protein